MKKVRNFALLMLLFFTLSGGACGYLMAEINKITLDPNWPPMKRFEVSVRTCDEKNSKAYWEVLNEMGYEITPPWVTSFGWQIDAVMGKDEGLRVNCWLENRSEKKWNLSIYSGIPYFPKERIHLKALERLKKQAK